MTSSNIEDGLMAKRVLARELDKFMLRLPPGLRGRIKAKADLAGISMNEAIVRLLSDAFPEPLTIERRLSHLRTSLSFLKGIGDADYLVDDLIKEVHETLIDVATGRVADADPEKRRQIEAGLQRWRDDQAATNQDPDIIGRLKKLGPIGEF